MAECFRDLKIEESQGRLDRIERAEILEMNFLGTDYSGPNAILCNKKLD
jgi:hypothetical protein